MAFSSIGGGWGLLKTQRTKDGLEWGGGVQYPAHELLQSNTNYYSFPGNNLDKNDVLDWWFFGNEGCCVGGGGVGDGGEMAIV